MWLRNLCFRKGGLSTGIGEEGGLLQEVVM